MTGTVLVKSAGGVALHRVTIRHAITMLVREVAIVEEAVDGATFGPFQVPRVLRLIRHVSMRWVARHAPLCTKAGVRARDRDRCGYCGRYAGTVDHILPSSRGGPLSWTNTIAACRQCNNSKADRTPAEAGMRLLFVPAAPTGLLR